MKFFLICDLNRGVFTKTEVLEAETCTYQIEYYSSLVCDCNYGCSNHGVCNYNGGGCLCDSKTNGTQCETSKIIIKEVYYYRYFQEDNISIFGFFGYISPMLTTVKIDRIEFSTTIKNIKLSLDGVFGTISNESTIHIGELQCNNIKQINDFNIVYQVDILQFGEKNVTFTDNDLSYTILKDFGNCTSHGEYEANSCLCDSKTKGDHCEISKIYIDSVKSPTIDGGLTFIYGFFGNISENSTIDIGSNQFFNILHYYYQSVLKMINHVVVYLKGVCTNNGCICKSPWVGIDCSSKVIIIPQPSKNDSNPTIEFEINDEQTNKYNNNNKLFKSIISTTDITITLQCDIKMNPSTIKYTIEISKYNFKNKLNRLQLIISAMMIINKTSDDDNNNNNNICSIKEFGETIKEENSNYLKIQIDNHSIYARFIKRAQQR
ncbi:hypothetical protein DDB_G0280395 [Dictyostelium discoideum AX4]|uniref:EGF-like domain-containing protein n=1 Tax=Dictyostelium discoideum TaxID=44689 RepID=Q54VH4_DICDI|nr:hypothetical protein DDB_G0280395 [Dictyostelium discoideum AX4]EAL67424.1 hypothetical protein DDB_G0280395 [Dictyostelium discoideum AX4]|eukprot:XP_641381.1 hypothetical protein DDB_G0280395 [Dictyostelium discoideum AX4]